MSEYFIIDRQYVPARFDSPIDDFGDEKPERRDSQIDLVAIRWPRTTRRVDKRCFPILIECKYSMNSGIETLYEQLDRYRQKVIDCWTEFTGDMGRLLQQRAQLGLFGDESGKLTSLIIDESPESLGELGILFDYNPNCDYEKRCLAACQAANRQIRIVHCGFALWD